jgi:hypothetical protein
MPLNLSSFCASLGRGPVWRFCCTHQTVTADVQKFFSRGGAKAQSAAAFPSFFAVSLRRCVRSTSWHGRCEMFTELSGKENRSMKTVVSFLLGAVMLFGAATLGLQSATANAKDKHDKNYWKHHHHRHHKHHRHQKNHLSY